MDGVICKPRDNWRLLEELDGVFAHDDSWRRHQNDKFKFVLTRMRIQRTQAGYVCFKFAGGLQIHGRKNDDDDECYFYNEQTKKKCYQLSHIHNQFKKSS